MYNVGAQVVASEADIKFDSNGLMTAGFTHGPGIAGVNVVNAGIYRLTFIVLGVEPSQMAVFLNGAAIEGSISGSGAGTQPNTGQVIASIASGDVITLRNHTSAAAVTLPQPFAGGTRTNTNATIVIERIG